MTERRRLPGRRNSTGFKATIGGQTVYLRTGEYEDGSLGEIFVTMGKRGEFENAAMDAFAIVFSIALQHGTPLEALVHRFVGTRSEPYGMVQGGSGLVKMTSSVHDWIARELGIQYLGARELASGGAEAFETEAS